MELVFLNGCKSKKKNLKRLDMLQTTTDLRNIFYLVKKM